MFILKLDTVWNLTLQIWQKWGAPLRKNGWQYIMKNSVMKCPSVGNKPDKLDTKQLKNGKGLVMLTLTVERNYSDTSAKEDNSFRNHIR